MNLKKILLENYSTAADRKEGAAFIDQYPKYFPELLKMSCVSIDKRKNILAAWILEKYSLNKLECLTPDFSFYLKGVYQQTNDSKRRPMAKLLYHYCNHKNRRKQLTQKQIDIIIEICFHYMLTSLKVAPIAFAMKTLHFFRNNKPWISEEIEAYIEKKLHNSSTGFQSVVRQIS